jgi:hypothetical protein
MDGLPVIELISRGSAWLCLALSVAVTLYFLLYKGGGQTQRSPQQAQALKNVPTSAMKQARQLIQEGKPLLAVNLLTEAAGLSNVDAHAYVKAFQAARQGHLSFGEALTVELACDVKAHLDRAEREQAVKLLVTRAGAPQAEAVRLVELLGSSRSQRGWIAARPLPETGPGADLQQVDALVAQGNPLEAIKLYRQLTGASLKEAKEYVDSRAPR